MAGQWHVSRNVDISIAESAQTVINTLYTWIAPKKLTARARCFLLTYNSFTFSSGFRKLSIASFCTLIARPYANAVRTYQMTCSESDIEHHHDGMLKCTGH